MRASRPPAPPTAPPNGTLFGPFTLIERLAVGGMAEVFRALEPRSAGEPREIVVKRMLPHIAAEPGSERMFEEESHLGARVEHANVVRVLSYGLAEKQPYLALELVPGLDLFRLARWLDSKNQSLGHRAALFVACELLAGLHAVHEATGSSGQPLGIVHGDVTPSNVLLSVHGDVKLADFGIAEARLRSAFPQAAAQGRTKGKLGYLAPEQVRGEVTDRRADVFAAGVVTAELLIAESLFVRGSELAVLLAVRDARVDPLLAKADTLPDGLLDILLKGLAREAADRFANAADFRRALLPFVEEPPSARRKELGKVVSGAAGQRAPSDDDYVPATSDVTMEPPLEDYLMLSKGKRVGPITFAALMEGVTTGRFGPEDAVEIGGRSPKRLGSLPELSGQFRASHAPPDRASDEIDLGSGFIIEALARGAAKRRSGMWVCTNAEKRKEIYLIDGTPEFVSSNLTSELLGEFLVANGVLGRGELDMALAVLPRFEGRLGDTLAALGLVEPVELFRHIAAQVHEKLTELFTWTEGEGAFHEGEGPPARYFPLGLDPWRVLNDGIERRMRLGLEDSTFQPHLAHGLARTRVSAPRELPPDVEAILNHTRRPCSFEEIAGSFKSGRDANRPHRAVRIALALGLVRWTKSL